MSLGQLMLHLNPTGIKLRILNQNGPYKRQRDTSFLVSVLQGFARTPTHRALNHIDIVGGLDCYLEDTGREARYRTIFARAVSFKVFNKFIIVWYIIETVIRIYNSFSEVFT